MSPELGLAIASAAATASALVSTVLAKSRTERQLAARDVMAKSDEGRLTAQRDAAERRARELGEELAHVNATSLARHQLFPERAYAGRIAPRDAEALAAALAGLAFVDATVVADAAGLPVSRGSGDAASTALAADYAALAADFARLARDLDAASLTALEVHIETRCARHVTVRPLSGRSAGAFLVAASTSRPVSPLALDAIARLAQAERPDGTVRPQPPAAVGRGTTECRTLTGTSLSSVFGELERVASESGVRALVLGVEDAPVFSCANDGPDEPIRTRVLGAMRKFEARAAARLHGLEVARVDVQLAEGQVLHWAPVAHRSGLSLVTMGAAAATAPERLERLLGRIRRADAESTSTPIARGAA